MTDCNYEDSTVKNVRYTLVSHVVCILFYWQNSLLPLGSVVNITTDLHWPAAKTKWPWSSSLGTTTITFLAFLLPTSSLALVSALVSFTACFLQVIITHGTHSDTVLVTHRTESKALPITHRTGSETVLVIHRTESETVFITHRTEIETLPITHRTESKTLPITHNNWKKNITDYTQNWEWNNIHYTKYFWWSYPIQY